MRSLIFLCMTLHGLGLTGCGELPMPHTADAPSVYPLFAEPFDTTDNQGTLPMRPWFNQLSPLEVHDAAMISHAPLVDQDILHTPRIVDPIARRVHVLPAHENR